MFPPTICALLLLLSPVYALAQETTKLSPEPVSVLVENGKGEVTVIFAKKGDTQQPTAKLTEAVGSINRINEKDVHFDWQPATDATAGLMLGRLSVDTQTFLEPGVLYKGKLILLWPNAAPSSFDYVIQNPTSVAFDVFPEQTDLSLAQWQPKEISLRIKNTGKSKLTRLLISSLGMKDSATGHRIDPKAKPLDLDLNPGLETLVTYPLPQPDFAGTYNGALDITMNQSTRKSIALTLRSRGPNPYGFLVLPFLLFVAVLGFGFWLSSQVEEWFGQGGLQRAEANLSLKKSQSELTAGLLNIQKWQKEFYPAQVVRTELRLESLIAELADTLKNAGSLSLTQLINEVQRFAAQASANAIFWLFLQRATEKFKATPGKLQKVATALDNVDVPEPPALNTYRDNLLKTLQSFLTAEGLGGGAALAPRAIAVPSPAELQKRIEFMARLYRILVCIVVFVTAYQTLYVNNRAFGTLLDYIAVFLWTLGLTQTGTQILSHARSTYTRPTP